MTEPGGQDAVTMLLGRTDLRVSRLGIGAMVWGDMSAAPWWSPGPAGVRTDQHDPGAAGGAGG